MWGCRKISPGDAGGTGNSLTPLPESRTLTWARIEGGYCMILLEEGKLGSQG